MRSDRARAVRGPDVSVVIPSLGSHDTLEKVLDGYCSQSVPMDSFEVILVVDAAEGDHEAVDRAIGSRPLTLRRLEGPRPGASANRNTGWRAARSDLVLFTDNDTIPTPGLLTEHLQWHQLHPRETVGVLGLVRWDPSLRITTFMRWLETGIQFDYANMRAGDVGWGRFYSANVSLKRRLIELVGDFDQDHFPYGYEDTDWAYRASKHGFELLYNPDAVVNHLREVTLDFWKRRARRVGMAEYEFCRRHPETSPWFRTLFEHAVSRPPARGRGIRLAPCVGRGVPWVGKRVWDSVDLKYKQEIAPYFLEGWAAAAAGGRHSEPDLSEWD